MSCFLRYGFMFSRTLRKEFHVFSEMDITYYIVISIGQLRFSLGFREQLSTGIVESSLFNAVTARERDDKV